MKYVVIVVASIYMILVSLNANANANEIDYNVDIEYRLAYLKKIVGEDFPYRETLKHKSYAMLGVAHSLGCKDPNIAEYFSKVLDSYVITNRGDNRPDIFVLPALVRYIYQFGDCLTSIQKRNIIRAIELKRNIFDHGTTNHAAMQSTSWYLLAQYFYDIQWIDIDNTILSSSEVMARLKSLILKRAIKISDYGHNELFSPTYAMVNLIPSLNLFDFATDAEVKGIGDFLATVEVTSLRVKSFNGVIVPPLTRRNFDQINFGELELVSYPSVSQQILSIYYGLPYIFDVNFKNVNEPAYFIVLLLSDWRPPFQLNDAIPSSYYVDISLPDFVTWHEDPNISIIGRTYVTKNYAVGASNYIYNPASYNEGGLQFGIVYRSMEKNNLIECYHSFWNSNAKQAFSGIDRSSPFVETHIEENIGFLMLKVPRTDPWINLQASKYFNRRNEGVGNLNDKFHCRFPLNFSESFIDGNRIHFHYGDIFISFIGFSDFYLSINKASDKNFMIVDFDARNNIVYYQIDDAISGESFNNHVYKFNKNLPNIRRNGDSIFTTSKNCSLLKFENPMKIENGRYRSLHSCLINRVHDIDVAPVNAPFYYLKQGQITIKYGDSKLWKMHYNGQIFSQ